MAFGTNAYVLSTGPGSGCLVVDPGIGVLQQLEEVLTADGLTPEAVVLTHGHLDHVHAAPDVASRYDVPVYIHPADRYRLVDPFASLPREVIAMLEPTSGPASAWREPSDIRDLAADQDFTLAGLRFRVVHAPGHTEGSVLLLMNDYPDPGTGLPEGTGAGLLQVLAQNPPADPAATRLVLSGDVLFAGSIGRTDLPGGSSQVMRQTIADVLLKLPDHLLVLPGHGAATSVGQERYSNPFLQKGGF